MLTIKQGNSFPDVEEIVTDENDVPVDITGYTITFSMRNARNPSSIPINDKPAVVTNGPLGAMAYQWGDPDPATLAVGTYEYLFYLTPPVGDAFFAPTAGWGVIVIEESF
jgi:hypothetical protein